MLMKYLHHMILWYFCYISIFNKVVTDQRTDGRMDGRTDGHTLL